MRLAQTELLKITFQKGLKEKKHIACGEKAIIFICFYFGVAPALDFFTNLKFLGMSFFVTIVPYLFLFYIFFKNIKIISELHKYLYAVVIGIFLIISCVRSVYYDENLVTLIGTNRYIVFVPLVLMLFEKLNFRNLSRINISLFLFIILVIHALNSIFYIFGLPFIEHVDILADNYVAFGRFGGLMGGANVQAVFTSTIYLILVSHDWKMSLFKFLILTIVAIVAIVPTLSKGGALVIIMGIFYYFSKNMISATVVKKISLIAVITALILFFQKNSYLLNLEFLSAFSERLNDDDVSSGRWDRLDTFWTVMNNNLTGYFIGVPGLMLTEEGNDVSDNVFTLLPVNFGVIFTFIFLIYILIILSNYFRLSYNLFIYSIVILIISLVNNSIIWTAWTYYVIFGFFYIFHKRQLQMSASQ